MLANTLFHILILSIIAPVILFILLSLSTKILFLKKIFTTNTVTSLSAGLLLSLTFFDFIPHSLENDTPINFSLTILMTLAVLFVIETHLIPKISHFFNWFPDLKDKQLDCTHYHQHHHHLAHKGGSFSAIGCMLVCAFFDGIRLGSALFIDLQTTLTLSLALIAHILPEGILVMGLARSSSLSFRHCMMLQGIFCILLSAGIISTGLMSIGINILALTSASLIYVCFIHLLPVALQKENQKWFFFSLILTSGLFMMKYL